MVMTDADQLREALRLVVAERDEAQAEVARCHGDLRLADAVLMDTRRARDEALAELVSTTQQLELEREHSARLRRECEERHDELRVEVERLRFVNDCRGDGLTYECNLTHPCVACRLRTVAERQREACELHLRTKAEEISADGGDRQIAIALHRAADRVEDTPLVTEGDK